MSIRSLGRNRWGARRCGSGLAQAGTAEHGAPLLICAGVTTRCWGWPPRCSSTRGRLITDTHPRCPPLPPSLSTPSFPPAGPLPRHPPPAAASSCSSAQPQWGCRGPLLPSAAAPHGGRHRGRGGGSGCHCHARPASALASTGPSLLSPNSVRVVQGFLLPNSASPPPPPPTCLRAPASPRRRHCRGPQRAAPAPRLLNQGRRRLILQPRQFRPLPRLATSGSPMSSTPWFV
ncbi:hypothetical protein SETIT_7G022600v2 [Setaria italica]|uniref:Uncharacterized protein n=1 Tax=Setaria italica TaxID=4555 RepID=A0A368RRB3_SETIT|nr:hypothetical protein SETIT_7G022600v2 [Setaria italica]